MSEEDIRVTYYDDCAIFEKTIVNDIEAKVYNPDFFKMLGFGDAVFLDESEPATCKKSNSVSVGGGKADTYPYRQFVWFFTGRDEDEIKPDEPAPKSESAYFDTSNMYKYFSSFARSVMNRLYRNSTMKNEPPVTDTKSPDRSPAETPDGSPAETPDVSPDTMNDSESMKHINIPSNPTLKSPQPTPIKVRIVIPIHKRKEKDSDKEKYTESEKEYKSNRREERALKLYNVQIEGESYALGDRTIRLGKVTEGYQTRLEQIHCKLPGTLMAKFSKLFTKSHYSPNHIIDQIT
jgi:hypothetical protein